MSLRGFNAKKSDADLGLGWWELPEFENYQARGSLHDSSAPTPRVSHRIGACVPFGAMHWVWILNGYKREIDT